MKRSICLVVVVLVSLLISGPVCAKSLDKIRIATEGAFAPWNLTNSSGQLEGFEIDLAQNLCKRMNVECEVVSQAWDGIIPALQAGKYDAIMAGMSITEKRKKAVQFSRYYAATPATFVVLKDSSSASFATQEKALALNEVSAAEQTALNAIVKEFKGKTIGVQTSTIHEKFLRQYLGENVDIRTYDSQENLDLDLQAGRVDAVIGAMSYWVPMANSEKGKDMKMVGPGMTGGPFGAGVGVAVRKGNTGLASNFSKAIDEALADGTVSKLAIKWFTFDASAKN